MTVEDKRVAPNRLRETVRRCLGVFYANDGMVGSQDADWLQQLMNVLVSFFQRYGLAANVAKSRTMTCQPGLLRSGMSAEAKAMKCTGVGYLYRVRLRQSIPCPECGVEITRVSMMAHCRCMHRMEPTLDGIRLPVSQTEH